MGKRRQPYTVRGDMIRALRLRKKHWTQEQLGKSAGITVGQVSRIETGVHQPQMRTLEKIAESLGVDVDRIVRWNDPDLEAELQEVLNEDAD